MFYDAAQVPDYYQIARADHLNHIEISQKYRREPVAKRKPAGCKLKVAGRCVYATIQPSHRLGCLFLLTDNLQMLRELGQRLTSVGGDNYIVFDAHAATTWQVDSGLNCICHTQGQKIIVFTIH